MAKLTGCQPPINLSHHFTTHMISHQIKSSTHIIIFYWVCVSQPSIILHITDHTCLRTRGFCKFASMPSSSLSIPCNNDQVTRGHLFVCILRVSEIIFVNLYKNTLLCRMSHVLTSFPFDTYYGFNEF